MINYKKLFYPFFALKQKTIVFLIAGAYLILSFKLLRFVYSYSENVLFWDQWDIFDQVLKGDSLFNLFF